jgi:conjugative transposon TraN protein
MSKTCLLSQLIAWLFIFSQQSHVHAQKKLLLQADNYLGSYSISVAYDKTTHLIFPHKIVYVDLGSADLIAEKVEKVENIIKVKANVENFSPTNMTVLTAAGSYFSFIVNYQACPDELSIVLKEDHSGKKANSAASPLSSLQPVNNALVSTEPKASFENTRLNQLQLDEVASWVINQKRSIHKIQSAKYDMVFALRGLYIKDDLFFYHLHSENESNINFDIDFIRIFICDKKVSKRTTSQEKEIFPLHIFNKNLNTIPGSGRLDQIFVMEKITIPDDKMLRVELFEKKGGRHLSFQITHKDIIKARLLP